MKIALGADHRGFDLKEKIKAFLKTKSGVQILDAGAFTLDPLDDFPQFSHAVAEAIQLKQADLGIVLCGSAVGVSIAANRFQGIYCGLGFLPDQVKSARAHDNINVLALPSDYLDSQKAFELIDIFLETKPLDDEKYLRRLKQIDSIR